MSFDPDMLINASHEQVPDDRVLPCPEGDWLAQLAEVRKPRVLDSGRVVVDLVWEILDDEPKRETGREKVTVRQSLFLDLTEDGRLDFSRGKNVALGALLKAVGVKEGEPWSLGSLVGRMARVRVKHRTDDDGNIYDDVRRVFPAE